MPGALFQCWWGVQWRIWSEGWCSPRLCTQPAAFHHCAGSLVMWVPMWSPMGGPLCWRPCYHSWITRGMCQKVLDMERSNGGERAESQERQRSWSVAWGWISCRGQVSSHVLSVALEWAATASSAKAVSTGCIRSAVGSSTWQRTLITGVYGAREQYAP